MKSTTDNSSYAEKSSGREIIDRTERESNTRSSRFRYNIYQKLTQSTYSIPITIAEILVLMILPLLRLNLIYIALVLTLTLSLKYLRFQTFKDFGFMPVQIRTTIVAISVGVIFGLLDNIYLGPYVSSLLGKEVELGNYNNVKGNVAGLIGFLALGWIVGGLFEEYFFRGYIFNRLGVIFKNPLLFKASAILLTSLIFAFAHSYQGISGIVSCFYFSVVIGWLYFLFNKNTWYLVLIHGFYDTVGITMLFLGV